MPVIDITYILSTDVVRVNIGKKMLLVASKNIRKGEEISDNYCIHFSDMKARERREWLEVSKRSHRQNLISNNPLKLRNIFSSIVAVKPAKKTGRLITR